MLLTGMLFFDRFRLSRPVPIQQSFDDMRLMLSVARQMFVEVTAALFENEILEMDLRAEDEIINRKEQEIRRAIHGHLANHPQDELELSLVLLCIIQDAERLGDMTKSLADALALSRQMRMGPTIAPLRHLRDRIYRMYVMTESSFAEKNEAHARQVMEDHLGVKADLAAYLKTLSNTPDVENNEIVVLTLATRLLSRTSSHLSNISSSVALPFEQLRCSPNWN